MATSDDEPQKGKAQGPKPKGPRPPTQPSSHARAAKARAAKERQRRNQIIMATVASVAVIAVVAILIAVKVSGNSTHGGTPPTLPPIEQVPGAIITTLSGIPAAQLADASKTTNASPPAPITGQPALTSGGLPQIVYVGAEYCPYCAAERWAVVTALSHFGTFTGLGLAESSSTDVDPSTPTMTFHGSTYSSQYLVFSPVEETSATSDGNGGYLPLDTPSALQTQLISTYDKAPYTSSSSSGGIPFIDFGNKWVISGASYDPAVLKGMNQNQVATAAADPGSAAGKAIQAAAGQITADVCQLTNNMPADVCGPFAAT